MNVENVSLECAWAALKDQPDTVLIDVRTQAEWSFVGTPDLSSIQKQARLAEWTVYPSGSQNPHFLHEATDGIGVDKEIYLLCRSGARSLAAANALRAAGYARVYNVIAGFEGDLDIDGHRGGGWKDSLPWRQG